MESKKAALERILGDMGPTLVAFSGGLDSGYLLHVAHRVLGDRVVAVTARSAAFAPRSDSSSPLSAVLLAAAAWRRLPETRPARP